MRNKTDGYLLYWILKGSILIQAFALFPEFTYSHIFTIFCCIILATEIDDFLGHPVCTQQVNRCHENYSGYENSIDHSSSNHYIPNDKCSGAEERWYLPARRGLLQEMHQATSMKNGVSESNTAAVTQQSVLSWQVIIPEDFQGLHVKPSHYFCRKWKNLEENRRDMSIMPN